MAHTFTQQTGGGATGFGPRQAKPGFGGQPRPQHQQPRPQHQQPRPQHQPPRLQHHQQSRPPLPPLAKKGCTNISVEVPDELLAAFKEKNAADGKTGPEVINQLISAYNLGKVIL